MKGKTFRLKKKERLSGFPATDEYFAQSWILFADNLRYPPTNFS